MLDNFNIDQQDAVKFTKYPFTEGSTLAVCGSALPPASFVSVRIMCSQGATVSLTGLQMDPSCDFASAVFTDSGTGAAAGIWRVYPATAAGTGMVTALLYDADGVLTGHLACVSGLPCWLYELCRTNGGDVQLDRQALVLRPECTVPAIDGTGRVIAVSGTDTALASTGDVRILLDGYLRDSLSSGVLTIDAAGPVSQDLLVLPSSVQISADGLLSVAVCMDDDSSSSCLEVPCRGKHLIVRSGLASNLRVLTSGSGITLHGVLDAD